MTMEKQLSEEESLLIIGQMIDQAKQENKEETRKMARAGSFGAGYCC
jgi:hypothetical protein